FAAGVVLYWMATGDKPFGGDSILSVQYKVVNTEPIPPRKLNPAMPRDYETVILKCLAKDPAERYQTGGELAKHLRSIRMGESVLARAVAAGSDDTPTVIMAVPPSLPVEQRMPPSTHEQPRRTKRWLIAVAMIVVFISGATVARLRMRRSLEPPVTQKTEVATRDSASPAKSAVPATSSSTVRDKSTESSKKRVEKAKPEAAKPEPPKDNI